MSKMDALRAMREANYAANQARANIPTSPRPKPAPAKPSTAPAAEATEATEPGDDLCGHRNMSGRTCTREKGHSAKSHRYS